MTGSMPTVFRMVFALGLVASHATGADAFVNKLSMSRPQTAPSEKAARTPAQQKINSQLLYEIYRRRGVARQKGVPPGSTGVRIDARGRALVDVRAVPITEALQKTIRVLGVTILSISDEHHSILARVPLLRLEGLAADMAVRFIEPAGEATTNPSIER